MCSFNNVVSSVFASVWSTKNIYKNITEVVSSTADIKYQQSFCQPTDRLSPYFTHMGLNLSYSLRKVG